MQETMVHSLTSEELRHQEYWIHITELSHFISTDFASVRTSCIELLPEFRTIIRKIILPECCFEIAASKRAMAFSLFCMEPYHFAINNHSIAFYELPAQLLKLQF